MKKITTIGLDLAKSVFQVHGIDAVGVVVVRRKLKRCEVLKYFGKLERCLVGMEACSSAHYWAREISALGHEVKLMAPIYVKAYVKRNKNDPADAEAICEAVTRPSMRFVPVKSQEEQATLSVHRVREALVRQRTRLVNVLRSHLSEFGIIAPQGIAQVLKRFDELDEQTLPALATLSLSELRGEIEAVDKRVRLLEKQILVSHRANEMSRRLATIDGVGPMTASMITATVPDPLQFRSGRHFAAWIGLVPKQNSSGGKDRLGHISKMGNRDLRRLLVMCAASRLRHKAKLVTGDGAWMQRLLERKPGKLAIVALANKMARIVWALMVHGGVYHPNYAQKA